MTADDPADLSILADLPEILEKAIKEKHIDEETLNKAIAARDKLKTLIKEVDKDLADLMKI